MTQENKLLKLKLEKKKFKDYLQQMGKNYDITEIVCNFSGSGDSGDIDAVTGNFKSGYINKFTDSEYNILSDFFYKYLEYTEHDWYNNDGGQGNITLNIDTGEIICEMGINFMDTEEYTLTDTTLIKNYELPENTK